MCPGRPGTAQPSARYISIDALSVAAWRVAWQLAAWQARSAGRPVASPPGTSRGPVRVHWHVP
eukprot:5423716-Pyramimonas_sp.AAC.1